MNSLGLEGVAREGPALHVGRNVIECNALGHFTGAVGGHVDAEGCKQEELVMNSSATRGVDTSRDMALRDCERIRSRNQISVFRQ